MGTTASDLFDDPTMDTDAAKGATSIDQRLERIEAFSGRAISVLSARLQSIEVDIREIKQTLDRETPVATAIADAASASALVVPPPAAEEAVPLHDTVMPGSMPALPGTRIETASVRRKREA